MTITAISKPSRAPDGRVNANPRGISFWRLVREDFVAHGGHVPTHGFWALFWHRFGNWRMDVPRPFRAPFTVVYRVMYHVCNVVSGISLPYSVPVGRRVKLQHSGGVVIVARSIGDDVTIRHNTTFGVASSNDLDATPVIGDRVDIGTGAVIVGDVVVGDDVIIGANAVVVRDVPSGAVVGGVPARIIKRRAMGSIERKASVASVG